MPERGSVAVPDDIIYGRNPVWEILKDGKPLNKVLFQNGLKGEQVQKILDVVRERGIPFQFAERSVLDRISGGGRHQGLLVYTAPRAYAEVGDILALAQTKGEDPFILVLDGVEDPHNLGALLRTAEAVGVHGVIIPKRRSVPLTGVVAKTSAGAVEHIPVARVINLVRVLQEMQRAGCWICGADASGTDVFATDLTGPRVLVIGGEGKGLGRLVRESCDQVVALPMLGAMTSLNASVAGAVLLYETLRQRLAKG